MKLYTTVLRYLLELDDVIIYCSKEFSKFFEFALKVYKREGKLQIESFIVKPNTSFNDVEHRVETAVELSQSGLQSAFLVDSICSSSDNKVYLRDEKSAAYVLAFSNKIPTHLMFSDLQRGVQTGTAGNLEIGIPISLSNFSFLIWEKGIFSVKSRRYFATFSFEEI